MTVVVYSKPGSCPQCTATKRELDKRGIPYEALDIDDAKLEEFRAKGYAQAPVVFAGDQEWTGFRPDLIAKIQIAAPEADGPEVGEA